MKVVGRGLLVLAIAMALAVSANAQIEQGRLIGTVTDAQGGVLPGVTVTATSPALIGTQTTVTQTDGQYRFPSLPSGTYALTFELAGFQTVKREGIVLTLTKTLTVDAQMPIASLQESITVTGESPVVDSQGTAIGSEFSSDKLASIPSATDLWAALSQAPGVRMLGFDIGGSHKSQQTGYESFGVRNQNRVLTEGVDTTEGTGGAGFYQDFFAHEEISVSAAGGDVTMSTPGSAVFSSIKSGGNNFKSLLNLTYEDGSFVGRNVDDENRARGDTGQPNLLFWEGHADLGGPIKTDKIWFYAAYNHFKIDKEISGVARQFSDLGVFDNYTGKATYKPTQKDTVIGYYQWGRKFKPRRGLSNTIGPDSILAQDSRSWMYNGQHQRVWTDRLFTDLKIGLFGFGWPMTPSVDWRTSPPREDTGTGVQTGAGWLTGSAGGPFTFDRNKPQFQFNTTYFLPDKAGSHDFKVGVEWLDDQSKFANNGNSGPILYRDLRGAVDEIRMTDLGTFEDFGTGWTGADDRNERWSAYFQDRWRVTDRFSLSLGVRWDRQRPHYQASIRKPVLTAIFPAQTTPEATLLTSSKIVPRLGASWDPQGNGRSVVKAFYGRYYYNFADRLGTANPGGTNTRDYKFNDLNGNRIFDGVQELGDLQRSTGGSSTTVDPNLRTPYADEASFSFEQQFWGESSFRAAYVRKMVRGDFTTLNINREGQFTIPRTVSVPIQRFGLNGTVTESTQTFTVFDVPAGLGVRNLVTNIPTSVGGARFDYDTIQFAFNKRFPRRLFLQSSFDYQWRDELKSVFNNTNSPLNSDPLAIEYFQNIRPEVSNRQLSTNWQGRFLGRYEFPYAVGFAVNVRVQSGWNWARLVAVSLPNAGTQRFFLENIENNRSETAALLDLRAEKAFRFGRYAFTVMADLFNVTNSNAVTNFNLLNGSQFNRINATLDPRTFMLGFRFDF